MIIALGTLLLLASAASAVLLFLSGQLTHLPWVSQAVYLIPSAYVAVLGIGLMRAHRAAYEAAKAFGVGLIAGLGTIAAVSALITAGGTRPLIPLAPFAIATGVALVIGIALFFYARRTLLAQRFWREWRFPPPQVIFSLTIVIGILSVFLWKDALTARDVAAALEPYTLHRVAASEPPPANASTLPGAAPIIVPPAPHDPAQPPGIPDKVVTTGDSVTPTATGEVFWLNYRNRSANFGTSNGQFWNPATGALRTVDLPVHIPALTTVTALPRGLLFVGGQSGERDAYPVGQQPPQPRADTTLVLVTLDNKPVEGKLSVARGNAHVLALSDTEVLVVGGVVAWGPAGAYGRRDKTLTGAVERVTIRDDEISTEKLPDLPGGMTHGYALVALGDDKVMLLGGSDSTYLGCWHCTAATYILDLNAGTWRAGPSMTEPRAYPGAALLPDGSVLVAGGWTPTQDWNQGPTRTTERWDPRTNTFSPGPPLIVGTARLRPVWEAGQQGKRLLLAGGTTAMPQVYDVSRNTVRVAGDFWAQQENFGEVPVQYQGDGFLWLLGGAQPFLVKLRRSDAQAAPGPAVDFDHKFYRAGIVFVPARDNAPALALGGTVVSRQPSYYDSVAVDAIWPDGRVQSLAPLNAPRAGGRAFRLADQSVLLTGSGGSHAEWLPATGDLGRAKWVTLDASIPGDSAGQLADGSLIWASDDGSVTRLTVAGQAGGKPAVETEDLPALGLNGTFTLKGLPDGRIIAIGATRATEYVARLPQEPDENDNNAEDTYVPLGEESPVNFYQIYDPQKKAWHPSAPQDGFGNGRIAVLDDGRVVSYRDDGMQISSTDGKAWHDLPNRGREKCLHGDDAKPFALENEFFLSGCDNGHTSVVQWFDFAEKHWTTIWQRPANDDPTGYDWVYSSAGRVISRVLPDGKRVTLPIQGP